MNRLTGEAYFWLFRRLARERKVRGLWWRTWCVTAFLQAADKHLRRGNYRQAGASLRNVVRMIVTGRP